MSGNDVDVIIARFEDFKEHVNAKFAELNDSLAGQCSRCQNVPVLKERVRNQWWHIAALWTSGSAVTVIFIGYLWQHVSGR